MAAAAATTTSCAIHISSGCRPPSSPISNSSTSATLSLSSSFSSALKNHSIFIHFKKDYIINNSNKKKTKSKKNNKGLEGSTLDLPSMRYWSRGNWSAAALGDKYDVIRLQSNEESTGRECYSSLGTVMEREWKDEGGLITTSEKVTGLAFQGGGTTGELEEVTSFSSSSSSTSSSSTSSISATTSFDRNGGGGQQDPDKFRDRAINATIVLAAGTFVITKLLTVDRDYWHGWTLFEILRYAPQHNWIAYEEALRTNPVLAKMMISGIVYSVGDWIAQCYEGKPLFEFDRTRMFRSGLVGFTLHGSLSHYYYHFCEAIFPFEAWWVVPAKVAFDQTIWSAIWNSIYFVVLGFLRLESPLNIFSELRRTFWPLLTAGWKLWPFAHLVTYGLIPVEQRLLWVDCVELVWVTILSTYSNENSEKKNLEISSETDVTS